MTTIPELSLDAQSAPPVLNEPRPFYWSVRRELWENRSLYFAPLIVTAFVLFGSLFGVFMLPKKMRGLEALDPAKAHAVVVNPFTMAPAPIMFTTMLVGMFYALDALYGERRDRSILFWKSLPVSDLTTVLSKAAIPLFVLPVIGLVLSFVTVSILLLLANAALLAHGMSPGRLWSEYHVLQEPVVMVYGVFVHVLWHAPIYCWFLLISAWAKRTPLLWAVLPPLGISMLERMISGTKLFAQFLGYRFIGAMGTAFGVGHGHVIDRLDQLTPLRFLATPGLWAGLLFAALCIAAAVRLRRNREPI